MVDALRVVLDALRGDDVVALLRVELVVPREADADELLRVLPVVALRGEVVVALRDDVVALLRLVVATVERELVAVLPPRVLLPMLTALSAAAERPVADALRVLPLKRVVACALLNVRE